jgi:hypothetical protein
LLASSAAESSSPRPELVRQQQEQDASWPVGKIEISTMPTKNRTGNGYGRHVIEIHGNPGPYFADASIHYEESRPLLTGSDGWGRQQWQIALAAEGQRQNFFYNRAWTYARAQGHLLLTMLGWKIMAIDTLGSGRNASPRVLWTQDLTNSAIDPTEPRGLGWALPNMPWQWQQQFARPYDRATMLGPVTSQYVCFQRFRNLVAVSPENGATLWVRQDIPPGSELFGDEQFVFVLSPEREEAMLLRATDGELLGTRKVPRQIGHEPLPDGKQRTVYQKLEGSCLATLGRRLLLWWPEGDKRVLTLVDPLEGRDVWPGRKFPASAHTCMVGEEAVGIMQPSGRFLLLGLPDGHTIANLKLEAEPTLIDISLVANGGQHFLITRSAAAEGVSPLPIQPLPGCSFKPIYRGRVYAIDGQGKLRWPAPAVVENQYLLLDQPARLPLLSFACQVYQQKPNGEGRQKMSLLAIDKRTGRTAYKAEFVNNMGLLDITGDAPTKTVDLIMQRDTVRLTFTDKSLPPPSAADQKPASPQEHGIRALWNSIERGFGRLFEDSEDEEKW